MVNWIIRLGLIITGSLLCLQGIITKENNKEDLVNAGDITVYANEFLGCIGFIITFILGGFLKFLPVWLVKSLWFSLGIGFILLGLLSNLAFLLHY
ncbi:hypothetical protein V7148_22640 [Gottfriedia acidiceleris]|uniref:hypothetical protein n=1 Tax=Bacillaceae TaxID=186817 RepID=UPI000BEE7D75|nr:MULTISPECIES: hypothetical protein [unclassified Bacillus (in: firmicutes)]PEC47411.1 hypothetical protein CON00_21710 [Bacillus sp. AFS096315]PFM76333.1 hypothetical protein COJ46_19545 [Bacillus sp. AFS077874]